MGVKVNSTVWNSIFAIPACVADEHIKRANGQQLKVVLYIFRHNNETVDEKSIATGTGMTVADVKDAMQYWIEAGLVLRDGAENQPEIKIDAPGQDTVPADRPLTELPDVVPTYEQVAARTLESPEIRGLFNEAQLRLGKTIGYDAQAKLLMIHDCYGLPVEVILTIIEYSVSHGKASMKYIEKVAKDWAEREINTLEAADKHIKELLSVEKLWKKFEAMFSVEAPKYTDKRCAYLKKWNMAQKQSLELIYYAYEETVNRTNKMSFEYMDRMLQNWHEQGLRSPVDVMQAAKDFASKKGAPSAAIKSSSASGSTSYNSEKFKKKAQAPIEYKRRNANE